MKGCILIIFSILIFCCRPDEKLGEVEEQKSLYAIFTTNPLFNKPTEEFSEEFLKVMKRVKATKSSYIFDVSLDEALEAGISEKEYNDIVEAIEATNRFVAGSELITSSNRQAGGENNEIEEQDSSVYCQEQEDVIQKNHFVLTITTKRNYVRHKALLLYKEIGSDLIKIDSAYWVNGKFKLKGEILYPLRASIRLVRESSDGRFGDALDIYLEEGHIQVTIEERLQNAKLKGTPLNNDLQAYRNVTRAFDEKIDILNARVERAYREKDTLAIQEINIEHNRLLEDRRKSEKKYFDDHLNSLVALDWLERTSYIPLEKSQILVSFDKLSSQVKNSRQGKRYYQILKSTPSVEPGSQAPDFLAKNAKGKNVTLNSLRGNYVLLYFWASWNDSWRGENDHVLKIYNKYKSNKFKVLGFSLDSSSDTWMDIVTKKDALPGEQVADTENVGKINSLYAIRDIPCNFLIDPKGKIIATDLFGEELEERLERILGGIE